MVIFCLKMTNILLSILKQITLKGGVNTTILSPYLTINIDAFVKNKQKVDPFLGFEYLFLIKKEIFGLEKMNGHL